MSSNAMDAELTGGSVEFLYENVSTLSSSKSSSETPMEEWSSLENIVVVDSPKMTLFKAGLYDPGSGDICTKYIPISDSEILKHVYYDYPGVKDPGIMRALLEPEDTKNYPLDGQELYLDLCQEMNITPVRKFHRGMLDEVINLKYYGVNPVGVRAMCQALTYNRYVRRLDLTSNFLSEDGCYHLGRLLGQTFALQELVLSACSIQSDGMRKLTADLSNRTLNLLDLSKNNIGDQGFLHLVEQMNQGAIIKRLNISHNGLGIDSALAFAEALKVNNTITHLNLSWNKLSSPKGINKLLLQLGESKVLVELNLAWNALTVGTVLTDLLTVRSLQKLNLSNNRLTTPAAEAIVSKLVAAKKLNTLDLSFNLLTPSDALLLLKKMRFKRVKLLNLLMENVSVEKQFVQELNEILALAHKKNLKVTYGRVIRNYVLSNPDIREIILKRMDFLTSRASKKYRLDTALYFLGKYKECELIQPREILNDMKSFKVPVDEDLVGGLANAFPGPKTDKGGSTIKLASLVEMIQRMWPDKKLPPTPPEPKSEVIIVKDKNDKQGKKNNDKKNKKRV